MFIKLKSMNLSEGLVFINVNHIVHVRNYENGGSILSTMNGTAFVQESVPEVMEKIAEAEGPAYTDAGGRQHHAGEAR